MQVLGSSCISLSFPPERKVFLTTAKVVRDIPYGIIVGVSFCYQHKSAIIFEEGKSNDPTRCRLDTLFEPQCLPPYLSVCQMVPRAHRTC